MNKQALIFLSDGCEEIEAVTTIDLLVRAGITVVSASINENREIGCSRGVVLLSQKTFSQVKDVDFDVVILPGGLKGAENFRDSPALIEKLKLTYKANHFIAAICAAPALVLQHHNLFPDAYMTGFPATKDAFKHWQSERVYLDKTHKIITSQGPGTAIEFSLKIIESLLGRPKAAEVAKQLVIPPCIDSYS